MTEWSRLGNKRIQDGIKSIYGSDNITKSADTEATSSQLVKKKVMVKRKDGSTHVATRWVKQDSGDSHRIHHGKYRAYEDLHGDTDESKIQNIVNDDSLNPNEKVRRLAQMGVYDRHELAGLSGHKYPADIPSMLKREVNIDVKNYSTENTNADLPNTPAPDAEDLHKPEVQHKAVSEIQALHGSKQAFELQEKLRGELMKKYGVTIDDKWNSYESRLNRLITDGFPKAVMAYGTGGVGKTYTFEKLAEHNKLIEYDPEYDMEKGGDEYDYIKIGGKIGSREMQRVMYEHRNKLIVFDDCDSMWNDEGLINVLKNTLDTSGSGKCQWSTKLPETSKGAGDDVPSSFRFEGRMLFITNLTKKELNERGASPIAESRASSIDLTMDMQQTIDRLDKILPYVSIKDYKGNMLHLTPEDKHAGLEALKTISQYARVEQLNTRTLGKILGEARSQRMTNNSYDQRGLAIFALQEFGLV